MKHLSRLNNNTSPLIGKCESYGNIDGSFSEARFQFIRDAVKISDNEIAMTDSVCTCIRFINMQNESVNSKINISYIGRALVVDKSGENLYFTAGSRLGVVNLLSNQVRILISSHNNPQWASAHFDGPFSQATLSHNTRAAVFITKNILLITDIDNYALRVVDLVAETVSSICTPGSYANYRTRAPYCPNRVFMISLMTLPEEGKVLLGGYDMIGYLPFGGKYDQPSVIT